MIKVVHWTLGIKYKYNNEMTYFPGYDRETAIYNAGVEVGMHKDDIEYIVIIKWFRDTTVKETLFSEIVWDKRFIDLEEIEEND